MNNGRHLVFFNPFFSLVHSVHRLDNVFTIHFENLKVFNATQSMPYFVPAYVEVDPFFDKVKDDPEFQEVFQTIED